MNIRLIDKKTDPLTIKFEIKTPIENQTVLFVWEDTLSKCVKHIDSVYCVNNVEYYSTINKDISFFENGITFKIISIKDYKCLYSIDFKNLNFIRGKNVLYISQNGYTGYSYAARNYIYQLLEAGYNVSWSDRFTDINKYIPVNDDEKIVQNCLNQTIDYDSVIIHHTPEAWLSICNEIPRGKHIYGLTTWETTHLHKTWVDFINNSVDEVIVPSKFNQEVFNQSGINKPIHLWYHDTFPFQISTVINKDLFTKFLVLNHQEFITNSDLVESILKENTVYYNISQYVNRKNVDQVITTFCKKFNRHDNVCLFIKTFVERFDKKETDYLKYKIIQLTRDFINHPKIIFCFEMLNNEEINYIHKFGDVYFTLNHGEGFGLCTYTAKKMGNKVICGKFGAEPEFLDDNDILLDYELKSSDYLNDFSKLYIGNNQKCAYFDTNYVLSKLTILPKSIKKI